MIAGNVDLLALEEGETVTFTAYNPKMLRSSQVEVSSGGWYYYADYGLGSYLTCPFTVSWKRDGNRILHPAVKAGTGQRSI